MHKNDHFLEFSKNVAKYSNTGSNMSAKRAIAIKLLYEQ